MILFGVFNLPSFCPPSPPKNINYLTLADACSNQKIFASRPMVIDIIQFDKK